MKSVLPNRPGRVFAMLGFFVVAATLGWSGEKRVWVQYQSGAKGPVMAALASAGGRVHYEFDHLGAVAVSLPEQALNGIGRNPHVTLLEEDPIRELHAQVTPYGITMVQAPQAIAAGADGTNVTVGVIDSGVFQGHEDFTNVAMAGEPGGNPSTNEVAWNRDRDGHGTHVTGTIVAASNSLGVVGVSPGKARIYMVKVFGDSGTWIYSSTLLAAVQNAVNNGGARIISMSLGGGTPSVSEQAGLDALYDSGVLLIAAAGNAGNTATSYPAGYDSVISVAAVDSSGVVADFSQKNSTVELAAPGVGVLSTVPYRNAALTVGADSYLAAAIEGTKQLTVSGALIDGGRALSTNSAWSGKVVLVERGDNSFRDKVTNVEKSGGKAAVIYNNEPGGFSGTLGGGKPLKIPSISITQEDGVDLRTNKLNTTASVSTVAQIDVSGYDYYDGTSMATPHVSGVAALLWSKYWAASNVQLRTALQTTASDSGASGRDNSYGYGLVQAKAALDHLASLGIVEGGPPPPPGDNIPPVVTFINTEPSKGKPGSFTVNFTTDEEATGTVTIPGFNPVTTSLGFTHSAKFQGVKGATYDGTITATDAANNTSGEVEFTRNN